MPSPYDVLPTWVMEHDEECECDHCEDDRRCQRMMDDDFREFEAEEAARGSYSEFYDGFADDREEGEPDLRWQ